MTTRASGDSSLTRPTHTGYDRENTFSGVASFMRRRYTKDLPGVDVAVSDIPLDLATTHRPGARLGPAAIRAATADLNGPIYPWGFGPCDRLAVVDYGDCWLDVHRADTKRAAIVEHARTILAAGAKMLTLGGDHFITYPLLIAHVEKLDHTLSLIHFDAHRDTWPADDPDSLNHGTMFYKAVRERLMDPASSVQVGIRSWNDDFMGLHILGADRVHAEGPAAAARRIIQVVGDRPAYLTIDIDCLNPAFAPGTSTPVSGGLTTARVLAILRQPVPLKLIGMDVVEVSPPYDLAELTALAAAQIAAEGLCLLALKPRHDERTHGESAKVETPPGASGA